MRKLFSAVLALTAALTLNAGPVDLQWIDRTPAYGVGQKFGIPFAKGEMNEYGTFTLTDASGNVVPSQTWTMARWNDGSVKWMGVYASVSPEQAGGLKFNAVAADKKTVKKLSKQKAAYNPGLVKSQDADAIVVDNGLYEVVFPTSGSSIISRITMGGHDVAVDGRLVVRTEDRSRLADDVLSFDNYESKVKSAVVEHTGDVATVIKVDGVHKALKGGREWLPFTVRFYIYKDMVPMNMVHSFVFDGDMQTDYIKGLGVEFSLPFREELQNRHVAFAGDDGGLWSEAVEPLLGSIRVGQMPGPRGGAPQQMSREQMQEMMRQMMSQPDESQKQFLGQRVADYDEMPERSHLNMDEWAKYNDYKLVQLSSDGFTIQKRTGAHSTWFGTAGGHRAPGYILAGDVSGGLGVSLKNFWQSFPAELDASDMRGDKGRLTVWMWSPSSDAMDLRHYDIEGHGLGSSYEDYVEGSATPYGIARTSELTIFPFCEMPSRDEMVAQSGAGQDIVQLMAVPQYLHDAEAFGVWSLPAENGNDTQKWMEEQIDLYATFYKTAQEAQRWYGFWNYGDFMHSYNGTRHTWNYDHGGKAWDNTELETDIWLWLAFIRSGRPDFYRLATAMTRHTSEVDCYHIGPMKGLGTRHNVSHWGCGAKEIRVGQAWWKRYYYYLFADDRLGDIMHESIVADEALIDYDPFIRAVPRDVVPTAQPTRLRWAPDWSALVGNWFTEWERTGDRKWLDKINVGMDCLNKAPNGLFSGRGAWGYDPATGVITYEDGPDWIWTMNSAHLANLQSSVEIFAEALDEIGNKEFNRTYEVWATWYAIPRDDPMRLDPKNEKYKNYIGNWNIPRLTALAAKRTGDSYLAGLAWKRFLDGVVDMDGNTVPRVRLNKVDGSTVLNPIFEDPRVGTNDVAQWNLEAIMLPALVGEYIPDLKDVEPSRTQVRAR